MTELLQLQPPDLWQHFSALNSVPRPSKHEARVIQHMQEFARQLGLPVETDEAGNVLIRKPASPGRENRPAVALQSHLDMVHQKNEGTRFDFATEGIRMRREGDWVRAEGTTLGADNGIGVAAMMAVLASSDVVHPPLEALFTIDEETGMTGARELRGGWLKAHTLLNLDTEDDDELTIGCAGGLDVVGSGRYVVEPVPEDHVVLGLKLDGLKGGHSGMDIHLGRGNANKLMSRFLLSSPARVAWIDAGGLRNAIPREATAVIAVADRAAFEESVREYAAILSQEYALTDPDLRLRLVEGQAEGVMGLDFQRRLLRVLQALPNGVYRMSPDMPGLVQTSNNLARVLVKDGQYSLQCLTRGSLQSEKRDMAASVQAALELLGAEVELSGDYPGWTPRPESSIVKLMSGLYREMFGQDPHVTACHAGLECGILGQNYPDMEMISFGPNIRGAHSPDECVQVSSVHKFWKFLTATLERL